MITVDDLKNLKIFPIVTQTDCKNIYRVYPLKQRSVAKIYEIAKNYPMIRKIYIFGSSVTNKCHVGSDLDICIDITAKDGLMEYKLYEEIGNASDWNCDILMYHHIGEKLKRQIEKEGVIIYEQSYEQNTE